MENKKLGIGIDLGTTNLLIYVEGKGIIFNEPSAIAFDVKTGEVIAGGKDAFSMIEKNHKKIRVSRPLRDGVITNIDEAKALLKYVFKRTQNNVDLVNSKCLICCPSEVTQIERDAMKKLAIEMGITDIFIEEEIKAGAIGVGANIYTPKATMIIDIGGGTTDIGVLSLGDIVISKTIRVAGNYIDQEIIKYVHRIHKLVIGQKTAESVKLKIATLIDEKEKFTRISGRDILTGLPSSTKISSIELRKILLPIFDKIINLIFSVLEQTPPELCADIFDIGIIVNGGGAMIPGIKELIEANVHIPVKISTTPLIDVVEGTKLLLKNRGHYLNIQID